MNDISRANREWKDEAAKRREKQEQSRNLPSRFQGSSLEVMYIYIMGGNTLDTDQDGCDYESTVITSLDGNYDPNTDDAFMTGICRGRLYKGGEEQDDKVLVLNDPRSLIGAALLGENDDTDGPDRVMVIGKISLYTPSDGPRTVYLVA